MSDADELPKSVLFRVVKNALPENVQVAKDAKAAIAKAARLFITYLASTANSHCVSNHRATISAFDIENAFADIDMEYLLEPVKAFQEARKKDQPAKKPKKAKQEADGEHDPEAEDDPEDDVDDEEPPHPDEPLPSSSSSDAPEAQAE